MFCTKRKVYGIGIVIACLLWGSCMPRSQYDGERIDIRDASEKLKALDSVFSSQEAASPVLWSFPDRRSHELWWQFYNRPIMIYIGDEPALSIDTILVN